MKIEKIKNETKKGKYNEVDIKKNEKKIMQNKEETERAIKKETEN